MKNTYTASAIRHIAPARDGNLVAVGLFERTVSIWNLATGKRISEFETVLGSSPYRLALSREESACLAAAWRPWSGLLRCPVRGNAMAAQGLASDTAGRYRAGWTASLLLLSRGTMPRNRRCDGRDYRAASWRSPRVGGLK